jgi:hypothetical protein
MRFLIRGADSIGNVANFVESEEIILYKENTIQNIITYEQIRGSIPLMWTQEPNLQLNPLILPLDNYNENYNVFKRHIDSIKKEYGDICIVNLIDKKKDQKTIGDYFTNLFSYYKENNKGQENNIGYAWFDFHSVCKNMKYGNLIQLLKYNSVNKSIDNQGFTKIQFELNNLLELNNNSNLTQIFHNRNFLNFITVQAGVFRTNCIDCLDRTNVVQSVFARIYLHKMLYNLNVDLDNINNIINELNDSEEIHILQNSIHNLHDNMNNSIVQLFKDLINNILQLFKETENTIDGCNKNLIEQFNKYLEDINSIENKNSNDKIEYEENSNNVYKYEEEDNNNNNNNNYDYNNNNYGDNNNSHDNNNNDYDNNNDSYKEENDNDNYVFNELKEMFQNKDESELRDALRRSNGNFDQALNLLLNN